MPKTIKTKQSNDAEPQYDYMHIASFTYDDFNHPLTIIKETYCKLKTESEDKNVMVYSISTKLEYSLTEDIVTQTDIIKTWMKDSKYNTHTEKRVYNITSGGSNIIEVTLNDKYKETIELSGGLAVKSNRVVYSDVPEETVSNYVEEYKYNDKKDISEYTYSAGEYTKTEKYSYDSYNGTYKNVSMPQWLFIALFKSGQNNNIKEIDVSQGDKFVPFGENIYKYNSAGYVNQSEFRVDSEWIGVLGSKTTYEYIDARDIALK